MTALLVGAVWLLSLIEAIVIPVVTAGIIAAVLSPLVRALEPHMRRGAAAAIVFVALLALGIAVAVLVLAGITSQASSLSFTALSLFFLLKDGPQIREWTERHMGIPSSVARMVTRRTLQALRGYFAGVTAVAAFNGVLIGLGALVLGVPEAGSIGDRDRDGGDRAAGQRCAPAADPADRVRRDARHPSAGRPDRHDRGRRAVRHHRAHPRCCDAPETPRTPGGGPPTTGEASATGAAV